jgi:molybdopterin molybdotransferase
VRQLGLAAAMNRPWLRVARKPRVAILATGDEVVMPGEPVGPNQIVSSNGLALAAFVRCWGGEPVQLGIAPDRSDALQAMAEGARGADLLVTTGGASVGEHDLVRSALGAKGLQLDFWQIAMRPGKPLMFGRIGATPMLGLPGNPVSSLVCSIVFLRPILLRLLGARDLEPQRADAVLGADRTTCARRSRAGPRARTSPPPSRARTARCSRSSPRPTRSSSGHRTPPPCPRARRSACCRCGSRSRECEGPQDRRRAPEGSTSGLSWRTTAHRSPKASISKPAASAPRHSTGTYPQAMLRPAV